MDDENGSSTWLESLCQKLEVMRSDVDEMFQRETQNAVDQLETMGTNITQFCSDFVKEMLPRSIVESMDGTDHEDSNKHPNEAANSYREGSSSEVCVENRTCTEISCLEKYTESRHCIFCTEQKVSTGANKKPEVSENENQDVERLLKLEGSSIDGFADEEMKVSRNEDEEVEKHPELGVSNMPDKDMVSEEQPASSSVNTGYCKGDASDGDPSILRIPDMEEAVKSLYLDEAKRPPSNKKKAKPAFGSKRNSGNSSDSGHERFVESSCSTTGNDHFSDSDWEIV